MTADSPSPFVPRLRFPEFQDTQGWSLRPLGEVLNPILREREKPTVPYTGLGIRSHGRGTFRKELEQPEKTKMERLYEVYSNDLIVSITFAWEGAIAIVQPEDTGALVSHRFPTYQFDQNAVLPEFFRYPILDQQFIYNLGVISPGGAGRNRVLNKSDFLKIKLALPEVDEQKKIADCLGSLDDLVAAEGRKLEALRQHKQGLMQQLFPQPGELVPRLRFPEYRDDPSWSSPQFADLYGFKRTNILSRDRLNYETGTIRNIHYGDIHTKFKPLFRVRDEYVPYINPDASGKGFGDDAFCEEGDIVLADASEDIEDVGKAIEVVSLDGERVVAGTHTILATRRGSVPVIGFGGQLIQSAVVRAGIKKEAQGAKVYGISAKRISSVPVPIPPTAAEQQKIAECLSALDTWIGAQSAKVDGLQTHKQGLLQQLIPSLEGNEQ